MLINDAMQQGPVASPTPPATSPTQPTPSAVSPTQKPQNPQELHRKLGLAAMQIIYDKEGSKALVEQMRAGAQDPINAVAQAVMVVLDRLKKSVQSMSPKVVYAIAPSVAVLLLEMADAAKLFDADPSMVPDVMKALAGLAKFEDAPAQGQPQGAPAAAPAGGPPQPPAMPPAGQPQAMMQGA